MKKNVTWTGDMQARISQVRTWLATSYGSEKPAVRDVTVYDRGKAVHFQASSISENELLWCEYMVRAGLAKRFRILLREASRFWGECWECPPSAFLSALKGADGVSIRLLA